MNFIKRYSLLGIVVLPLLTSCESNPQNVNVTLPKTLPEAKTTVFNQAIIDLGTMSSIYSDIPLRVMANEITDNTGTSVATSAEIPRDITAMVKSTLNAFGGNITFIPYDPSFMANTMSTGYSNFDNKIIPDIIVDGGITEFDRGLETKGKSTEMGLSGTIQKKVIGLDFEDQNKASLARVTLDFNLIDFQTFAGIPQMQAINTIKLNKAIKSDSIGFTILSSTFGAQGSVKKVQGRHAAIRLLVQLSMLQVIGKYQQLPYWRLLPGTKRDQNLLDRVVDDYYSLPDKLRMAWLQIFLGLHGHPIQVTGVEDQATRNAKKAIIAKYQLDANSENSDVFIAAYEHVPLSRKNKHKSVKLHEQFREVVQAVYSDDTEVAKVTPAPSAVEEKAAAPAAEELKKAFAGTVNLATNKDSYNIGEKMTVSFTVDEPMYVRVSVISSDGSVATLFPNVFQSDNYCKPGVTYQIPPPDSSEFSLDIGEPRGVDLIRAVGSRLPIASGQVSYSPKGDLNTSKIKQEITLAGTEITIQ